MGHHQLRTGEITGARRGDLADFYVRVVDETLNRGGTLYIVGYPQLLSETSDFDAKCEAVPVLASLAVERLVRLQSTITTTLNETIQLAITHANLELENRPLIYISRPIQYLDVQSLYRRGAHELCGAGHTWMNGIRLNGLSLAIESFHPNAAGHKATGEALAELISQTHPYAAEVAKFTEEIAEYEAQFAQYVENLTEYRRSYRELAALLETMIDEALSRNGRGVGERVVAAVETRPCSIVIVLRLVRLEVSRRTSRSLGSGVHSHRRCRGQRLSILR